MNLKEYLVNWSLLPGAQAAKPPSYQCSSSFPVAASTGSNSTRSCSSLCFQPRNMHCERSSPT
ncbi:hypothetical protein PF007_g32811 [Phytophthora fragariae]|uniref:Uncharacterized protein n=1 Tax=Phytophthora fragariae TaxID=53985 RepID=A0A6A3D873_9STRA|nr:hypothetical protein PF009_g33161 [Phytophthora fragariae]KAE9053900.1 hypothetical protein PF007_g32811 [Phytophthora fragariae]